jgi:hypothetical protein
MARWLLPSVGGVCYPNSNGYNGSFDESATAGGDEP